MIARALRRWTRVGVPTPEHGGSVNRRDVILALASTAMASRVARAQPRPEPSAEAQLGVAVDRWERDLGSVVADEIYVQTVVRLPRSGTTRESNRPPREDRTLRSEMTLIHFDDPSDWIGFRHVLTVNGRTPPAGSSPSEVLDNTALSWDERWRRVLDISAAFNIGSTARDVNLPTFALAALRSANHGRFDYSAAEAATIDGERLRVISFRERSRPTLVSGWRGKDLPLNGRVWFTAAHDVRRTEIVIRDRVVPIDEDAHLAREEDLMSRITVDFGSDEHVGAWVPQRMRERYDNAWNETTTCEALYSGFRRFRTSGRLVRPRSPFGAAAADE